jgi:Cu+-exporting ATPase
VVDLISLEGSGLTEQAVLVTAASLERGSEHPIGKSIVALALARGETLVDPEEFKAHGGLGVAGRVRGAALRLGKPGWFGTLLTEAVARQVAGLQNQGRTVMILAGEAGVLGIISVSDVLKPDSKSAIAALQKEGLRVIMLTGDNIQTARAIGRQVGVDEIAADVRPEEKAGRIEQLQADRAMVGMVGDGINDAPALARAHIGFAIGTGTDVAMETGDVILASGRLSGIPLAIQISRRTVYTIRQNLFLAFVYNIVLIPVAAGILAPFDLFPDFLRQLHPILAALAMAASSISVVTNSLRLYRADLSRFKDAG